MNNLHYDLIGEVKEKSLYIEWFPMNANILPARFNSISEPQFGGVIDIGPEISLPTPLQFLLEIPK